MKGRKLCLKNLKNIIIIIAFVSFLMIAITGCSGGQLSNEFKEQKNLIIKLCDEIIRNDYQQTLNSSQISKSLLEQTNYHSFRAHFPKKQAERIIQDKSHEILSMYFNLPCSPSYIGTKYELPASSYIRQAIRELSDYVKSIE